MKIFDCFTLFNEIDLLEFRLRYLNDTVDYFVIAESNLTHSGNLKPYYFEENINRFSKWKNKIIYLPVEQTTENLQFANCESYTPDNGSWKLENDQRNALAYVKNMIGDNDLVCVSDLDEIPDPFILKMYSERRFIVDAYSLQMLFHYYFMNCQNTGYERWWNGTVICKGNIFKLATPQMLRDRRNDYLPISEAGWHFSYLGGIEKIRTKIESFAHTEFNRPEITNLHHLYDCITRGKDVFNRLVTYEFVSMDEYPDDLRNLMLQYPQFIKIN